MKASQIYAGLQVVLNDSPNATVYTVHAIDGPTESPVVALTYKLKDGRIVRHSWVDGSTLMLPTVMQMLNA